MTSKFKEGFVKAASAQGIPVSKAEELYKRANILHRWGSAIDQRWNSLIDHLRELRGQTYDAFNIPYEQAKARLRQIADAPKHLSPKLTWTPEEGFKGSRLFDGEAFPTPVIRDHRGIDINNMKASDVPLPPEVAAPGERHPRYGYIPGDGYLSRDEHAQFMARKHAIRDGLMDAQGRIIKQPRTHQPATGDPIPQTTPGSSLHYDPPVVPPLPKPKIPQYHNKYYQEILRQASPDYSSGSAEPVYPQKPAKAPVFNPNAKEPFKGNSSVDSNKFKPTKTSHNPVSKANSTVT